MKELEKWQIISFISRGVAMALGIIQSFVIVRILTVTEWGFVQLAVSIGGALGIYQHLGLASASTREVSAAKDDKEIFKIFITSVFIRYMVTVPIAIGLFIFSDKIAYDVYKTPQIAFPLKIYAIVLLAQGFQSILNSVIAGTKRFKQLFLYQATIALVSIALYVPLIILYRVNGYFYAMFLFNLAASAILTILAFKPLKGSLEWPSFSDFKVLFKELFTISLGIYLVKIIYTNWEKLGPNLLGLQVSAEMVGVFSFGLLYAKKLMNVSDAVTDVNLPVFSDKFVNDIEDFKDLFLKNFNKIFSLIVFVGSSAVYWSPEIIRFVVGGDKYDQSLPLVMPLVFAFIFYSIMNIVKSSIFIPAKLVKEMVLSFILLIGGTAGVYLGLTQSIGNLHAMAFGMGIGSFVALVYMNIATKYKLGFKFFTHDHYLLLIMGLCLAWSTILGGFLLKTGIYTVYVLLYVWGLSIAHFVTKKEYLAVLSKTKGLARRHK